MRAPALYGPLAVAVLAVCLSSGPAFAQQNRPYKVHVDQRVERFVFLYSSDSGRLAASEYDIERWGLLDRVGSPIQIEDAAADLSLYWLDEIEDYDLSVEEDPPLVTLARTAQSRNQRLTTGRPSFETPALRRDWGADLTYRVSARTSSGGTTPSLRGDLGFTLGGLGRVVATVTRERQAALAAVPASVDALNIPEGPTLDVRDIRFRRDFTGGYVLQAGELGASVGGLSTGLRYLGASVGLNTLGRARTTLSSGFGRLEDLLTLTEPADVEVRVNGRMVTSQRVGVGRLSIADVPLDFGDNDIEILVRTSDGRTEVYSRRFVRGLELLGDGEHEIAASAGLLDNAIPFSERGYSAPFSSASYARGLSPDHTVRVTSEFRGGGERHLAARAEWTGKLPAGLLGRASASWSGSNAPDGAAVDVFDQRLTLSGGHSGWLLDGGIDYLRQRGSVRVGVSQATDGYLTMRQEGFSTEARFQGRLDINVRPGRIGTLGLRARHQRRHTSLSENSVFMTYQVPATAFSFRLEGGVQERFGQRAASGAVSVYVPLGSRRQARMEVRQNGTQTRGVVDLSRSLAFNETGLGWSLGLTRTADRGVPGTRFVNGRLQLRTRFFEAVGAGRHTSAGWSGSAEARGSLVLLGGQLLASRPVGPSFALVDLGEGAGASILEDRRPVGSVGDKGTLFIPYVSSLSQKRISINPASLRPGMVAERLQETISFAPGGTTVRLPIRRMLQARLVLHDENDVPWPVGSELLDASGTAVGVVGKAGLAYVVDVTLGGRLRAAVGGRHCTFQLPAESNGEGVLDLGTVRCVPEP